MATTQWTPVALAKAKAILQTHNKDQYSEACVAISKALRSQVTPSALRHAFHARNLPSPMDLLKAPPLVLNVIQRKEREAAAAKARREIADLLKQLEAAKMRQAFLDSFPAHGEPVEVLPREKPSGHREMTAVALASDWHVEETVEAISVAGRNEYNLDIAEQRIKKFFDAVLWNIEHQRASQQIKIRDLVLWLGGDLITGFIHEELKETNALAPGPAVCWLVPKLRDMIWFILEHGKLDGLVIPCSQGNHGRTTVKRHVSNGYANSFEWIMYRWLAEEFRSEPRIKFVITESNHQYVDVYGKTLHFHHGDSLSYQKGVGGIGIPLLKAVPQWDQVRPAEVHHIGHFHQLRDFGRVVVNGSLIGYNAYAQEIAASFEPPQQALYFMDSKRGKCLITPLWVD